jgi:hypothetical protein
LGAPMMGVFSLAPAAEPPGAMSERAPRDERNAREPPERAPRSRVWRGVTRGCGLRAPRCWKRRCVKQMDRLPMRKQSAKNDGC